MQLDLPGEPLREVSLELPDPTGADVLIEVTACGVCRTDLHIVDGDIHGRLPIVPGHEIVGRVVARGSEAKEFAIGGRVGVPWLGGTDGSCFYCTHGMENLCDRPTFTGFTRNGGYATHVIADSRFCLPVPDRYGDVEAAPLLCAGLIGYRALKLAGEGERIGFYGFGAAAHILAQVAAWQGRRVFAFTRDGDTAGQQFANSLGCAWAGGSSEAPPEDLDAAIIFAPVGALVPVALSNVRKGGRVVCAGIHMSDIPSFPYALLWGERSILSVANLTRGDGREFMQIAADAPIKTHTTPFPLSEADEALACFRSGVLDGAAVLVP
ncbi:MAG: zinc-dependent alcohol dehydrogenase family protein [Novosphingobium sp.]|nr:zinc-dependent alcohol dehydrogenase family protein [Novosphingobium sp.]